MLHHYMQLIHGEVNGLLRSQNRLKEDPLLLAVAHSPDMGQKAPKGVCMRLVAITPVELRSNPNEYVQQGSGFVVCKLPEAFYLYLLFAVAGQAADLCTHLNWLAQIGIFFQQKSTFTPQNSPAMQAPHLPNFSVELVKMNFREQTDLWGSLQLPQTPALLYKVGLAYLGEAVVGDQISAAFASFQKQVQ